MRTKAVLLDVDGTLIDSNDAHAHAWADALIQSDIPVDFATVRRLIGMGGDKLLPKIANIESHSPQGKAISQLRGEIFRTNYLPQIRPFPDVKALLRRMKQQELTLAVASSAKANELDSLLRLIDGDDFIQVKTSSDDVESSKPDPDIVDAAIRRLGLSPEAVILLGDTPYDVQASLKARIRVVALRCGGWSDADLRGAISVYDDPADLLIHFDESPFGEK